MDDRTKTCGTCAAFDGERRICRRRAPVVDHFGFGWPAASPTDWCMEWAPIAAPKPSAEEWPTWDELLARPEIGGGYGSRVRIHRIARTWQRENQTVEGALANDGARTLCLSNVGWGTVCCMFEAVKGWRRDRRAAGAP